MILVDSSVWIDHLHSGEEALAALLNECRVLMHPFVLGEIACGNLRNRSEVLGLLGDLPQAALATDGEVLYFIERHALMGRGIGYIDAHLLTAVAINGSAGLWTQDKRLQTVAASLDLDYRIA